MIKKIIPIIVAVAVIIGGGAFYGGIKYAQSGSSRSEFSRADFQNLSSEERQQRFSATGGRASGDHEGGSFRGGFGSGSGGTRPLTGEIITQNEDSFTIKLSDGSTKIVFVSDSTQITKSVDGAVDDLTEGKQIFVSGSENPDGSYTAQTIQLTPIDHNQ